LNLNKSDKLGKIENFLQALSSLMSLHAFVSVAIPIFESCLSLRMFWFISIIAPWFILQFYIYNFRLVSVRKKLDVVLEGLFAFVFVILIPLLISLVISDEYTRSTENFSVGSFFYITSSVILTLEFYSLYLLIHNISRIYQKVSAAINKVSKYASRALIWIRVPQKIADAIAHAIETAIKVIFIVLLFFVIPFVTILFVFYGTYLPYEMVGFPP